MESNKFEKVIFKLLRVFGVLIIIGDFLSNYNLYKKQDLVVFMGKTIIGNVYMISPKIICGMIVNIVIYLVFIKILSKHISITRKSIWQGCFLWFNDIFLTFIINGIKCMNYLLPHILIEKISCSRMKFSPWEMLILSYFCGEIKPDVLWSLPS